MGTCNIRRSPGWHIGTFPFPFVRNDLPDVLSTTTAIALFADDAKCSKVVRNPDDCVALQHDLNLLTNWSNEWGLSFNSNKCEILRISRKKTWFYLFIYLFIYLFNFAKNI